MRRGRIFIYLALIIILGLGAVYVLFQRNAQGPVAETGIEMPEPAPVIEDISVIVITQNTPRGTVLDETLLTTILIPKSDTVEGIFFTDLASVVGRRAKFDLDSGIPLTASMLVDSAEALSATGSVAALSIPRGKVAVSIPISRLSSVSYAPQPGDHVSVIVTMMFVDIDSEYQTILPNESLTVMGPISTEDANFISLGLLKSEIVTWQGRTELDPLLNELIYVIPQEPQRGRLVSQTLLPNVTVLQVGDFAVEEEVMAPSAAIDEAVIAEPVPEPEPETVAVTPENKPPDVITLIVSPQDAVTINYLLFSGAEMTLALRATDDDTIEATESATLQFLLDEYNITMPAKLPYGMEPRVIQPYLFWKMIK
ncbi:MAG: SAF domain-containing protein [Anaerolineales bacterium]|nr:SAF domain-containing protein [Anaerolineales bacterium]